MNYKLYTEKNKDQIKISNIEWEIDDIDKQVQW